MSTYTYTLSNDYHIDRGLDALDKLNTESYYFFVGDFSTHTDPTVESVDNTVHSMYYDVFNTMIMGKKLVPSNGKPAIRNIPYESDVVYTQYDDTIDLSDENYYCIVNATSYSHVFKCLYNNHDSNSTVQPDFAHIVGANTILYQTSDNYQWKYLYSVDNSTIANFATADYFPLVANDTVTQSAVPGSINVIQVEDGGKLYNNYLSGTFQATDIRVEPNVYQVTNSTISHITSFYAGCLILLTQGTGAGQYQTIVDYYANSTGNYITIDTEFSVSPTNGTQYEIMPQCVVYNNGRSANLCIARAIVNAMASNSISHVEILYPGSDQFIVTAEIIANAAVSVLPSNKAVVRPILPPLGGHGANTTSELNASHVILSVTLSNSESNTILYTNKFQQVGVIKNPIFANVELTMTGAVALFDWFEPAYVTTLDVVDTGVTVNTASAIVVGNSITSIFEQQFSTGEVICISNGTIYQISNVVTITDNNHLTISSNVLFDSATANVYWTDISETLEVIKVVDANKICVANSIGNITTDSIIIGGTSGTYATVSSTARNGISKDFNTFIQLYKYQISPIHGTFIPGETVSQGNNTALVHSVDSDVLYISAPSAQFSLVGSSILGANSGAEATLVTEYLPELEIGVGIIQYVDNIEPVTRQADQTETFKLVLDF